MVFLPSSEWGGYIYNFFLAMGVHGVAEERLLCSEGNTSVTLTKRLRGGTCSIIVVGLGSGLGRKPCVCGGRISISNMDACSGMCYYLPTLLG